MFEAALQLPVQGFEEEQIEEKTYKILPTIGRFHRNGAIHRSIIGPVGSGKTSGAAMEGFFFIPKFLYKRYGIKRTKGVIVRNTYFELLDTTLETMQEWFPHGEWQAGRRIFSLKQIHEIDGEEVELEIDALLRSCDLPKDVRKFKSLEVTWAWIDESNEVSVKIKNLIKTRIGRFPRIYKDRQTGESKPCPIKFFIETSNAPTTEQALYSQYAWDTTPPGPPPKDPPLENHVGFWQPPGENEENLGPGYYRDLRYSFRDYPDMIDIYIENKPGVLIQGKLVYANFKMDYHVAKQSLVWSKGIIYRGWDNSGNFPACVVGQIPTAGQLQIMREFYSDRIGIVDFTKLVVESCNQQFPGASYVDYGDPTGANQFSKKGGGFTSNAQLMLTSGRVKVISSDNNFTARVQSVDQQLTKIDGLLIDPSCTRLITGFMGGYHYHEIGSNTGIYGDGPVKNMYSHPHDGLQYMTVKLFMSTAPKVKKTSQRQARPIAKDPHTSWMRR